jgi:hypothetical protein
VGSGPSVSAGIDYLDMELGSDRDVRLWTVAPDFGGAGGTEVTGGGYAPAVLTSNPAVAGTGGQIAKATSLAGLLYTNMPVASGSVVAITVHIHSTGEMRWLDDAFVSPVAWAIGESPLIPAASFALAFVPVS